MIITYDKEADALYIEIRKGKVNRTIEAGDNFLIDMNRDKKVMGIEILNYSKITPRKEGFKISAGRREISLVV